MNSLNHLKVPVLEIIKESFGMPFKHFAPFCKTIFTPILISVVAIGLTFIFSKSTFDPESPMTTAKFYGLGLLLISLSWAVMLQIVAWNRYILLGEEPKVFNFSIEHEAKILLYFSWMVVVIKLLIGFFIAIASLVTYIPFAADLFPASMNLLMKIVFYALWALIVIPEIYFIFVKIPFRYSLAIPNMCLHEYSFEIIYNQTFGHELRLFGIGTLKILISALLMICSFGLLIPFVIAFWFGESAVTYKYLSSNKPLPTEDKVEGLSGA